MGNIKMKNIIKVALFASLTQAINKSQVEVDGDTPCCKTCEDGYEKYYSIPNQKGVIECGECCLKPSLYHFWKLFEPKLEKGECGPLGYTKYVSTETDGIPPL